MFFNKDINVLDVFGDKCIIPQVISELNTEEFGSRKYTSLICNNSKNSFIKKIDVFGKDTSFFDIGYANNEFEIVDSINSDWDYHLKFNTM